MSGEGRGAGGHLCCSAYPLKETRVQEHCGRREKQSIEGWANPPTLGKPRPLYIITTEMSRSRVWRALAPQHTTKGANKTAYHSCVRNQRKTWVRFWLSPINSERVLTGIIAKQEAVLHLDLVWRGHSSELVQYREWNFWLMLIDFKEIQLWSENWRPKNGNAS